VLSVGYAGELESLTAEDEVLLEQFAVPPGLAFVSRRVQCDRLTARFDSQGRLTQATAERGVRAEQEERRDGKPLLTRLNSSSITAFFAGKSNRVERIVAEHEVKFSQGERFARGSQAVYTDRTGLVELTGSPTASMPEGQITEAEKLVWDPATGRFSGKGKFKSEWKRPAEAAHPLSTPTARAE
jgi:hypothetical protein